MINNKQITKALLLCTTVAGFLASVLPASANSWSIDANAQTNVTPSPNLSAASQANLIIFVADDMGWADVGYHGSDIQTPTIDRLATQGIELDRFYAQPTCSPSRLSLLTGRSPVRSGITRPVQGRNNWPSLEEHFLGQTLQAAGYQTWLCGKWHLGGNPSNPAHMPAARGFDYFYGFLGGILNYYDHISTSGQLDWYRNNELVVETGYSTDLLAREAQYLIQNRDPNHPFYLQLSFNAPHTPLEAPQSYIDKYSFIESNSKRIYAAMVDAMDEAMGCVLDTVEQEGLTGNTLVLFFSDNGAARRASGGGSNEPLYGSKGSVYEGGIRTPAALAWPGVLSNSVSSQIISTMDLFPTLCSALGVMPQNQLPFDGQDRWFEITGALPEVSVQDLVVVSGTSQATVLQDNWKLIQLPAQSPTQYELYDLSTDPFETTDLASAYPDITISLSEQINAHLRLSP